MQSIPRCRGFTLVELSIVLVILGLLVGGILSGQSLIRAAEMRSISTQISTFKSASLLFRDKYFGLAGDITNATAFWGRDDAQCPGDTGNTATPGTCNGNGDGVISDLIFGGPQLYEAFRAWQQLALAGLITGNYTGTGSGFDAQVGVNVPATKIPSVGYSFFSYDGLKTGDSNYFASPTLTIICLGFKSQAGDLTEKAFMTQSEAWNIDTKIDDGMPGKGYVQSWKPTAAPETGNADCATDPDPNVATYKLSMNTISCSFNITLQ